MSIGLNNFATGIYLLERKILFQIFLKSKISLVKI